MGEQSSVSSLLKKGLACQKISGTRKHECGISTIIGNEKILLPLKVGWNENFVKAMNQEEAAFLTYEKSSPK